MKQDLLDLLPDGLSANNAQSQGKRLIEKTQKENTRLTSMCTAQWMLYKTVY